LMTEKEKNENAHTDSPSSTEGGYPKGLQQSAKLKGAQPASVKPTSKSSETVKPEHAQTKSVRKRD